MGDLRQEIGELLAEDSSPEVENETGRDEPSSETTESGEGGRETSTEGASSEAAEDGSQEKSKGEDSQEGDSSQESEEEQGVEGEEEDPRDAQIRKLQDEVNRLSRGEPQTQTQDQSSQEETQETSRETFDPMMGYEHDSIMESPDTFKEWASKLYEQAKKDAREDVLQTLPDTVESYVKSQVSIQEQAREFYRNNSELAGHKDYVSRVANEVAAEHPDWSFSDILEETGKRARQTLGLKQQAQKSEQETSGQKKTPAFASGTQGSNSKKNSGGETLSEVEKQIQSLIPENE